MRILVTGASGLVGGEVMRIAAEQRSESVGAVQHYAGALAGRIWRGDLTETRQREALLADVQPDAIIHCAAFSEPADCEKDPARAHQVNVELPAALAAWSQRRGVRLVHVSTEQVFGGDRAPYRVDDPVAPRNLYGRLKAESEQRVLAAAPAVAAVVRAPLMNGNSPSGQRSLHERLLADWQAGRTPRLFVDEIRQVAAADDLAAVLLELARSREIRGPLHWAGAEPLSRYELGVRLREHFQLNEESAPIVAVQRSAVPAAVSRPADLRLNLEPLRSLLAREPESLATQLPRLRPPESLRAWLQASRRSAEC